MDRELIVFNKEGTKVGRQILPELFYLQTEDDYIQKMLNTSGKLDGIAILIDWNNKEIICKRNLQ